ncbi:hypothetical protein M0811_10185 [Anaeramoeba ignava]|uniref:Rab3GAP regulatory subunit C-terminal domain-containing protein n=1 Tax=Anaeramoeba ignava TaxID=1746090 RepID=A0A9Q0LF22_ANAIG|nr:hypothetical protein M0811_10185 [Anaeramoeba ignava]
MMFFLQTLFKYDRNKALTIAEQLFYNKDEVIIEYILGLYTQTKDEEAESEIEYVQNKNLLGSKLVILGQKRLVSIIHSLSEGKNLQLLTSISTDMINVINDSLSNKENDRDSLAPIQETKRLFLKCIQLLDPNSSDFVYCNKLLDVINNLLLIY